LGLGMRKFFQNQYQGKFIKMSKWDALSIDDSSNSVHFRKKQPSTLARWAKISSLSCSFSNQDALPFGLTPGYSNVSSGHISHRRSNSIIVVTSPRLSKSISRLQASSTLPGGSIRQALSLNLAINSSSVIEVAGS
jgi:hypothetical protein